MAFSIGEESTYGTPVPTTKTLVFRTESLEGQYDNKYTSAGLKAGEALVNSDRVDTNPKGAKGGLELEFDHKFIGTLLKHWLGNVVTGATTDDITSHTITWGPKEGKSLTVQKKVVGSNSTAYPITYQGVKIISLEMSVDIDGYIILKLELDAQKENLGAGAGALAMQNLNYAGTYKTFRFHDTTITIGGSTINATGFTFKWVNNLDTERYYANGTELKAEPDQAGHDEATIELKNDFIDLGQQLRVASENETDAQAQVVITATATEEEPGGGFASFTMTLPKVSFNVASAPIDGPKKIQQTVNGRILWPNGSTNQSPVTIVLNTPDATI